MLNILNIVRSKQSRSLDLDISESTELLNHPTFWIFTFLRPTQILSSKVVTCDVLLHLLFHRFRSNVHCCYSAIDRVHYIERSTRNKVYSAYNLSFLRYDTHYLAIPFVVLFLNDLEVDFIVMEGSISMFSLDD